MRLALLASVLLLLCAGRSTAEQLDGIAAIVGDQVILLSELDQATGRMLERVPPDQELDSALLRQLRKEALESLINDKLIAMVAERLKIEISNEEVDTAIEAIAREEGVSSEQIYQAAAAQGLDRERYRRELADQMVRMRVVAGSVRSRVTVTDAEVEELYRRRYADLAPGLRVRARHILLAWPEVNTPENRAQVQSAAKQIREQALEGIDFAFLAHRYSALRSAAQGGLVVLREGDLSPVIAEQVFKLQPGTISEAIETEHGVNLFQVLERFDPSQIQLEDVRDALYSELLERKSGPEFQRWIEELRSQRYVGIVLPELQ